MSLLHSLFGPSRDEVWRLVASQMNGRIVGGDWWGSQALQVDYEQWTITLDIYTLSTGNSSTTYTRIRAPFHNPEKFRLTLFRQGLFHELLSVFGLQDIQVDFPIFDHNFVIQSNQPAQAQMFFSNVRLRELLLLQPDVHFEIRDDEGLFGPRFGADVDELSFHAGDEIRDPALLRGLFELFAEALHTLQHISVAYQDDINIHIRTLLSSGGAVVAGETLLWDANLPRWRAAEALGQTSDTRSLRALVTVLNDNDEVLVAKAVESLWQVHNRLAEAGAPAPALEEAVLALVPLLAAGYYPCKGGRELFHTSEKALLAMGRNDLVDTFGQAVTSGAGLPIRQLKPSYADAVCRALVQVVRAGSSSRLLAPCQALSTAGYAAALPVLKQISPRFLFDPPTRRMLQECIGNLERLASLPIASDAPLTATEALPRVRQQRE